MFGRRSGARRTSVVCRESGGATSLLVVVWSGGWEIRGDRKEREEGLWSCHMQVRELCSVPAETSLGGCSDPRKQLNVRANTSYFHVRP